MSQKKKKKKKHQSKFPSPSEQGNKPLINDWKAHRPTDSRQIKSNLMRRMGR